MRRTCWSFCISALLLCAASLATFAGRVNIVVDTVATTMPVTATISDTDVNQVLTTLFNSTKGKYQVQVGTGVTGTITNLTIANKPFDEALKSILAAADGNVTYSKATDTLYKVTSGQQSGVATSDSAAPSSKNSSDATKNDDIKTIKVMLKPMPAGTGIGAGGMFAGVAGATPGGAATDPSGAGTQPAAEECLLAMMTVKNIPVYNLCMALGTGSIPAFENDTNNNNNNSSSSGYYDSNGNWVSDNNNNNNNSNGSYDSNGNWVASNNNNNNRNNNYNNNNNNNNNRNNG